MGITRRQVIKTFVASGVLLFPIQALRSAAIKPAAWLSVDEDGFALQITRQEMGQGIRTSVVALVAHELGVEPTTIRWTQAPAHPDRYGRQETGGSRSIRDLFLPTRQAAAQARVALTAAAGDLLGVPGSECELVGMQVVHERSGQTLPIGDAAKAASDRPLPIDAPLRPWPSREKAGLPDVELAGLVTGRTRFASDVPAELVAVLVRAPRIGMTVGSIRPKSAKTRFVPIAEQGFPYNNKAAVAFVAATTWQAMSEARAADVEFQPDPDRTRGLFAAASLTARLDEPQEELSNRGRFDAGDLDREWSSTFQTPLQAHACLEPLVTVARFHGDSLEMIGAHQWPQKAQRAAAQLCDLPVDRVYVRCERMGGSFGRKYENDLVVEACRVALSAKGQWVRIQHLREDDLQHDFYQAACAHRITIWMDAQRRIRSWRHRYVVTLPDWSEASSPSAHGHGLSDLFFSPDSLAISGGGMRMDHRVGAHRGIFHPTMAFAINGMLGRIAADLGLSDIELMMKQLATARNLARTDGFTVARAQAVLDQLSARLRSVRARLSDAACGAAFQRVFGTYVAVGAVATRQARGFRVDALIAVADCGIVVNLTRARAQLEGGLIWGLSGALLEDVTVDAEGVTISNFHDYRVARMPDSPRWIETHLIDSDADPTGLGEIANPCVAPAIANAVRRLAVDIDTERLPLRPHLRDDEPN